MAENTPTTFDDRNLPIASGLSDLLQKTGKIQNTNLGEQVMSNNQVNNLIDVTKLNLPALQGYGFNGYKNLNADEQSFLNNQSQSQANQFNTLQNQLLLANLKGNQAVSAQVQNLKSNTGQFFDGAGVNANNSTLGLSLLNNANNIGDEQVRNNNQELANQLSQAQNQFQQTQVQLQGQALQQANTNKQYDRQVFTQDRAYGTETTGNIFVKDEKTGEAKMKLDSKNNPVYTNNKIREERAYQNSRDDFYTGLFGTLYNKNQPVIGSDGKPLFTQQGISNQLAVEAGKLSNTQASMNLNKMMLLQDSDIAAAIANNGLVEQKATNGVAEYKRLLGQANGTGPGSSNAPTAESPRINTNDVNEVIKYNLTPTQKYALGFKDANGKDLPDADKAAFKESSVYKEAIQNAVLMKNSYGEGYGTLFEIVTTPNSLDGSKSGTAVMKQLPDADNVILSPYTFLEKFVPAKEDLETYNTIKKSYSDRIKNSITSDEVLPKLFIKSQVTDVSQRAKLIVGIPSQIGDPYNPTTSTNFAEIDMTNWSETDATKFQLDYYNIANKTTDEKGNAINTANKVYTDLINEWEKIKPGFAKTKTSDQVIDLLGQPEYLAVGTNKIAGQVTRDLVLGVIAKGNKGNVTAILDKNADANGVSFVGFKSGVDNLTSYTSGSGGTLGKGLLDIFLAVPEIAFNEFSGVRPDMPADIVKRYNDMAPGRKSLLRDRLKELFTDNEAQYSNEAAAYKDGNAYKLQQSKAALGNLGLSVDDKNKINRNGTNPTYNSISSLYSYFSGFEPTTPEQRNNKMNQVKAIFKTTGVGEDGTANMLADIFTSVGSAYGQKTSNYGSYSKYSPQTQEQIEAADKAAPDNIPWWQNNTGTIRAG